MRKSIVFILALLLSQNTVFAGGLQASFTGVPNSPCDVLADSSSIACYDGSVLGDGSLEDKSGSNLLVQSEDFGTTWIVTNATISTDAIKNPVNRELTADAILEDGTVGAVHRVYQGSVARVSGTTYTTSIYVRAGFRTWVYLYADGEADGAQFNLTGNGIVGSIVGGGFSPSIHRVDQYWYRCAYSWTATATGNQSIFVYIGEADNDITFDGLSTTSLYLFGAQVREQRNVTDTNPGRYIATVAANKPWHDLAPTNAPGRVVGDLQRSDGNRITGRVFTNASAQYYSKADHDSIDVFDEDHTITVVYSTTPGAIAQQGIFTKGAYQTAGAYIFDDVASNYVKVVYNKSGGSAIPAIAQSNVDDGLVRVVQVIRRSNVATICANGSCGTPVSVSGYGIDGVQNLYLASLNAGVSPASAKIWYTHLQRRALSPHELSAQRENLLGVLSSNKTSSWDFSRTTTAYQTFSNGTIAEVAANIPRVGGKGGGVLIEGQNTQLHGLTEEFDSWSVTGTCAVTANDHIAPDGTLTADLLDNTGGANTDARYTFTSGLGDLTGRTFTESVWVRADTPHVISFRIYENPTVGQTISSFMATTEWQRFDMSRTCIGGGNGTLSSYVFPGERLVATGVAHFWGANLTETTFPVSYIKNTGVVTSQVTRTADSMTIDPHPEVGNRILPDKFENIGALTVEFDAKCSFSGVADIGQTRYFLDIGGNTGVSSLTRNNVWFTVGSDGKVTSYFRDDSDVDHYVYTGADPVDFGDWHTYKVRYDFSDLSRIEMWIDGSVAPGLTYSGNTGSASFDTSDTLIRLGQNNSGAISGACRISNLRISPSEF